MAEYQVIVSGAIIVLIAIVGLLGNGITELYHDAIDGILGVFTEADKTEEEVEGACIEWEMVPARRSGRTCSRSDDCDRIRRRWFDDLNSGSYSAEAPVELLVVRTGGTFHILTPQQPQDECITAHFDGNSVSWERSDLHDHNCRSIRHVQVWRNPLCP
jgi:hypothetical protein